MKFPNFLQKTNIPWLHLNSLTQSAIMGGPLDQPWFQPILHTARAPPLAATSFVAFLGAVAIFGRAFLECGRFDQGSERYGQERNARNQQQHRRAFILCYSPVLVITLQFLQVYPGCLIAQRRGKEWRGSRRTYHTSLIRWTRPAGEPGPGEPGPLENSAHFFWRTRSRSWRSRPIAHTAQKHQAQKNRYL